MEMIDWLVVGALVMSLINTIAIMGLGKQHEDLKRTIDHLIVNAMITSELMQLMEQEINGDD